MSQAISGVLLTLTDHTKTYNLLTLLQAQQKAVGGPAMGGHCTEVNVFNSDPAATIYLGGADLADATEYGLPLPVGTAYKFGPYPFNGFPIANVWVQGSVDGALLSVLVVSM